MPHTRRPSWHHRLLSAGRKPNHRRPWGCVGSFSLYDRPGIWVMERRDSLHSCLKGQRPPGPDPAQPHFPPTRLHLGTVLTVSSSGTRGWDALEGAHGPALQPGKLRPRWGGCFSSLPPLTHEVLISLTQSLLVSSLTPTASLSHRAWGP